jgi:hypothetical protein
MPPEPEVLSLLSSTKHVHHSLGSTFLLDPSQSNMANLSQEQPACSDAIIVIWPHVQLEIVGLSTIKGVSVSASTCKHQLPSTA